MPKRMDVYVAFEKRVIVLELNHRGDELSFLLDREDAISLISSLIRGLEELAVIRHGL